MKTTFKFYLMLAILAATTGCQTATLSKVDLDNSHWILTDWSKHVLPADKPVTLDLQIAKNNAEDNNFISGQSFCNRYNAGFTDLAKNEIKVGPVISTRMACTPEKMAMENAYLAQIQNIKTIEKVSGSLVLTTTDQQILYFAPY